MKTPQSDNVMREGAGLSPVDPLVVDSQATGATLKHNQARGILLGFASYVFWGLMPLFWKLLTHIDSFEILAHRLLWSALLLAPICLLTCRAVFLALFRQRRALLILLGAGLVCTFNWGFFIFAVNSGHVLQTSMGYYINPLMSIAIGLLFFKERLSPIQIIALILAAIGVLYFTIDYGSFPWMSMALAISFACYGALKKIGGYPALPALAVETTLVAPLAIGYVVAAFFMPEHAFLALDANSAVGSAGFLAAFLLISGGILSFIPMLLFSEAVNRIPLSWMGFLQYVSPTLSLLLGVFAFHEAYTYAHAVCFALIWAGLLLIVIENILEQRRPDANSAAPK